MHMLLMSGCGLMVAQLLLSQTVWKKLTREENVQPPTPNAQHPIVRAFYTWQLALRNWQSHDLRRTSMALGIVAYSAFDGALCTRGAWRAQAPAGVRFSASAAATCRHGESPAAHDKIWPAVARACSRHCEPRAAATGLHV